MFWAWRPREAQREKDNILKLTAQYEVAATCNKNDGEQNKQEKKKMSIAFGQVYLILI